MTAENSRRMDGWERWMELMTTVSPIGLLVISTVLALVIQPPPASTVVSILVFAVLSAIWIYGDRWLRLSRTMVGKVVFFGGLLVLSALLVWQSTWFTIFVIIIYGLAFEVFPLRWALFASLVVAAVQTRGFFHDRLTTLSEALQYVLLTLVIATMASAFTLLGAASARLARERKTMIAALVEANEKNAALQAELVAQAERAGVTAERQRMAREIHDTLAQGLTGIITQLEAAESGDWRRHVSTATWLARQSLAEARRSVHAVRPEALEKARLPEALRNVARQWSEVNGVAAEVHITGEATKLSADVEVALLRIAQEGLANAAKHARASRVGLTLSYMSDVVTLDVRDDGEGFDLAADRGDGFGLTGMRQRAENAGGSLVVETEPGGGTAISASVPIEAEDFVGE
ncbi:sensor histidine kinase [Fodinicola acaciae]|uniref:sensor histidine kinase n=1 Tax=Fodinicola acaciae TaxID=2681555 RepID=UPI0013D011C3|nr:sensor histidine kinase [Fodinicola acaciae]